MEKILLKTITHFLRNRPVKGYVLIVLCLAFLPVNGFSSIRFPEFPSKKQPLFLHLKADFFRTHANYLNLGNFYDLESDNYMQYAEIYPLIRYFPFPEYISFEVFSQGFIAETSGISSPSFAIDHIGGGISFYKKLQISLLGFDLKGGVPVPDMPYSEISLGNRVFFIEPGLWFLLQPNRGFYMYSNIAFRYRTGDLSSIIFLKLAGVFQTRNIDFGGSIDPFVSVISDKTSSIARRELLRTNGAGSYKFRSYNPSVLAFTIWMNLKFLNPLSTKVYFYADTLGEEYAKGISFGFISTLKIKTDPTLIEKRRKTKSFDFETDHILPPNEDISQQKQKSYFEEDDDPYSNNKELKKEFKSLRH